MSRLINVIIEHTNKDLEAIKRMKKQMDDIMATKNTGLDLLGIYNQYRSTIQTKQKLFKRTQHK